MTLSEYRKAHNMKQEDMVELLRPSVPWLTRPLFSLYERGLVKSDELSACIHDILGVQSDLDADVDKCIDKGVKPLTDEIWDSQTYVQLRRADEPLTRGQLVRLTGLTDRQVRKEISELRKAGVRIASSSGTSGYWLCKSDEDYRRLRAEMYSRIADMAKTVRAMDNHLPGQMEMR